MPLYEYECEACGHRFERIQKFSDPHVEVCPSCGEKKVHKLVSSPAIQFKGSGFYINDYAKKGSAGSETGTAEKSDPAAAKPAAATDVKDAKSAPSDNSSSSTSSGSTDTVSSSTTKT
jgi:putative FmdB family regulatory protein